jgi:hypothetical protein
MAFTAGSSLHDDSMPSACEPCPGNRNATRVAGTAAAGEGSWAEKARRVDA